MRTRVRFEADASLAAERITAWGYPYEITEGDLVNCTILRAERGGVPVAYLWLHFAEGHPDVLVVHACARQESRGRWMDQTVIARTFGLCELMGARYLATEPTPDAHPSLTRLYRRLGFCEPRPGLFVAPI